MEDSSGVNFILACDLDGGIGVGGVLPPWRLPGDLARFRRMTVGRVVIMGRLTWESLPRRPLPDRVNVVLSSRGGGSPTGYSKDGVPADKAAARAEVWVRDVDEAIRASNRSGDEAPWVIGGEAVFAAFLDHCRAVDLTVVGGRYGCDRRAPLEAMTGWEVDVVEAPSRAPDGTPFVRLRLTPPYPVDGTTSALAAGAGRLFDPADLASYFAGV